MKHGNIPKPVRTPISVVMQQPAFRLGVDDYRKGRPFSPDDGLPPLDGIPDLMSNRQRQYETGRLVAAFCRHRRRTLNADAIRAARKEGYLP